MPGHTEPKEVVSDPTFPLVKISEQKNHKDNDAFLSEISMIKESCNLIEQENFDL